MPLRLATTLAGSRVVAPCYHLVSADAPVHVRHLYRCRSELEFRAEIDLLLRHFKPIALSELAKAIERDGSAPKDALFLSVDDGFREAAEVIAPICFEKGVPVTFFVNTAFLDNRTLCFRHKASILIERCRLLGSDRSPRLLQDVGGFTSSGNPAEFFLSVPYRQTEVLDFCAQLLDVDFAEYLLTERPYLTQEQVERLLAKGFEIGGHSVDHPLYAELTLNEQLDQTRQCMDEIGLRFAFKTRAFAFPFVSDGVGLQFYRTVLSEGTAELIFCLGGEPTFCSSRLIQRFGVEGRQVLPLIELLRAEAGRKSLAYIRRWGRVGAPN